MMGAAAGILSAPITSLYPDMGVRILIRAFAAAVLGGVGSIPGAIIGGYLIGVIEILFGFYVATALIDLSAFLVIMVVLMFWPRGLFGSRRNYPGVMAMLARHLFTHRLFIPALFVALCLVSMATNPYFQYLLKPDPGLCGRRRGADDRSRFLRGSSLSQNAAFMGIGAYTVALLGSHFGVPYWVSLPIAGVLCSLVGCVVGLPALRLRRVYLGLMTMGFAELCYWLFLHWRDVTLGTDGVKVAAPIFFGIKLDNDGTAFGVIVVVTFAMVLLARSILVSRYGRAFIAIRENELVARCNGINVALYKTLAFALSGFYAGIGGGLFALAVRFVAPDTFNLLQVVLHFAIVMGGGVGTLSGALLGAVFLTMLPEVLRGAQSAQEMMYRSPSDRCHTVHAEGYRRISYRPADPAPGGSRSRLARGNSGARHGR